MLRISVIQRGKISGYWGKSPNTGENSQIHRIQRKTPKVRGTKTPGQRSSVQSFMLSATQEVLSLTYRSWIMLRLVAITFASARTTFLRTHTTLGPKISSQNIDLCCLFIILFRPTVIYSAIKIKIYIENLHDACLNEFRGFIYLKNVLIHS